MRKVLFARIVVLIFAFTMICGIHDTHCQQRMPEVMDTGSIGEQLNYIHERTLIYENYRAIREDIFQKMRSNTMDTLLAVKENIDELDKLLSGSNAQGDSLNRYLTRTKEELDQTIKNKNSLTFLGIKMSKTLYNTIMWSVIIALGVILILVFLSFSRNRTVTVQTRKDLEDIREEFDNYRTTSRERYEKLVVSHHHEIKKLKESR
jgi:preprotein translocase subunit SecF